MATMEIDAKKLMKAADRLRAIAHPLRIAIISLLSDNVSLNVTDISTSLKIEQPTASHHLAILKNKDILISQKDGKQIFYSLHYDNILKTLEYIDKSNY
jgi:DNA-binding transcriptional ArsR family regulator